MLLDLPEGQRESYPATSAGYCLRQSNERSEWAAIKFNRIKPYGYQLDLFTLDIYASIMHINAYANDLKHRRQNIGKGIAVDGY